MTTKNIALLDSVRRIAINEPADTTLIVYADRTLFGMYVDSGRNDEAHRILEEMLSLKKPLLPRLRTVLIHVPTGHK